MKKKPVFNWANPSDKYMAWELEPNEVLGADYGYYKLDFENFDFNKIDERAKLFDRDKMQRFLDAYKINIGVEEMIILFNLQSYIHVKWPEHAVNRSDMYEIFKASRCGGKDNPMLLSEAFNKKIAACVECSLLAQIYLQHCGIESKLCCGNMFNEPNPNIELGGGAHAYLVVRLNGREYIYDPANPMFDEKSKPIIPRIMSFARVPFKDRVAFKDLLNKSVADGGGFAYVEASDIYGCGNHWLYGFESNDVENHVGRRRTADGIKRQTPDQQGPQQIYGQGGRNY